MKAITNCEEKRMTVKEVAAALGVSENTIRRSLNALFPDLAKNGKVTLLDEAQVTAIKLNSRKNATVTQSPKTRLEKALLIKQAMALQEELIA